MPDDLDKILEGLGDKSPTPTEDKTTPTNDLDGILASLDSEQSDGNEEKRQKLKQYYQTELGGVQSEANADVVNIPVQEGRTQGLSVDTRKGAVYVPSMANKEFQQSVGGGPFSPPTIQKTKSTGWVNEDQYGRTYTFDKEGRQIPLKQSDVEQIDPMEWQKYTSLKKGGEVKPAGWWGNEELGAKLISSAASDLGAISTYIDRRGMKDLSLIGDMATGNVIGATQQFLTDIATPDAYEPSGVGLSYLSNKLKEVSAEAEKSQTVGAKAGFGGTLASTVPILGLAAIPYAGPALMVPLFAQHSYEGAIESAKNNIRLTTGITDENSPEFKRLLNDPSTQAKIAGATSFGYLLGGMGLMGISNLPQGTAARSLWSSLGDLSTEAGFKKAVSYFLKNEALPLFGKSAVSGGLMALFQTLQNWYTKANIDPTKPISEGVSDQAILGVLIPMLHTQGKNPAEIATEIARFKERGLRTPIDPETGQPKVILTPDQEVQRRADNAVIEEAIKLQKEQEQQRSDMIGKAVQNAVNQTADPTKDNIPMSQLGDWLSNHIPNMTPEELEIAHLNYYDSLQKLGVQDPSAINLQTDMAYYTEPLKTRTPEGATVDLTRAQIDQLKIERQKRLQGLIDAQNAKIEELQKNPISEENNKKIANAQKAKKGYETQLAKPYEFASEPSERAIRERRGQLPARDTSGQVSEVTPSGEVIQPNLPNGWRVAGESERIVTPEGFAFPRNLSEKEQGEALSSRQRLIGENAYPKPIGPEQKRFNVVTPEGQILNLTQQEINLIEEQRNQGYTSAINALRDQIAKLDYEKDKAKIQRLSSEINRLQKMRNANTFAENKRPSEIVPRTEEEYKAKKLKQEPPKTEEIKTAEPPKIEETIKKPEESSQTRLYVDVPSEEWLQEKINYAKNESPNEYGAPWFIGHANTAVFKGEPPRISLDILSQIRGTQAEQENVRVKDLQAIKKIMKETGKLPISHGKEHLPYIGVAYDGKPWIIEGNHRIMAAKELGFKDLPVEIRYFDGGERIKSGPLYPEKVLSKEITKDYSLPKEEAPKQEAPRAEETPKAEPPKVEKPSKKFAEETVKGKDTPQELGAKKYLNKLLKGGRGKDYAKVMFYDVDNGAVVTTDGFTLLVSPMKLTGENRSKVIYDIPEMGLKAGDFVDPSEMPFPPYKKAIEKAIGGVKPDRSLTVNLQDVLDLSSKVKKENDILNFKTNIIDINGKQVDPSQVKLIAEGLKSSGAKELTIKTSDSSTLITIEGDNGSKGYFQTLNPDFVPNEIRHLPENERQKIKQESKVYKLEGKSTKEFEVPKTEIEKENIKNAKENKPVVVPDAEQIRQQAEVGRQENKNAYQEIFDKYKKEAELRNQGIDPETGNKLLSAGFNLSPELRLAMDLAHQAFKDGVRTFNEFVDWAKRNLRPEEFNALKEQDLRKAYSVKFNNLPPESPAKSEPIPTPRVQEADMPSAQIPNANEGGVSFVRKLTSKLYNAVNAQAVKNTQDINILQRLISQLQTGDKSPEQLMRYRDEFGKSGDGPELNAREKAVVDHMAKIYDEVGKRALDAKAIKEMVEGYVAHAIVQNSLPKEGTPKWNRVQQALSREANKLETNFSAGRTYRTLSQLEEVIAKINAEEGTNLKVVTDPVEAMQYYLNSMTFKTLKKEYVNQLKGVQIDGLNAITSYKEGEIPTVYKRRRYSNKSAISGYVVHPDIVGDINMVLGRSNNPALGIAQAVKNFRLGGSYYHMVTGGLSKLFTANTFRIVEDAAAKEKISQGLQAQGMKIGSPEYVEAMNDFRNVAKYGTAKQFYDSVFNSLKYGNEQLQDWMKHDLTLKAPEEFEKISSTIPKQIDSIIRAVTGSETAKPLQTLFKPFDEMHKQTFEKMLPMWKVATAELELQKFLKKNPNATPEEISIQKRAISSAVNTNFGGQNWLARANEARTELGRRFQVAINGPSGRGRIGMVALAYDWYISQLDTVKKLGVDVPNYADIRKNPSLIPKAVASAFEGLVNPKTPTDYANRFQMAMLLTHMIGGSVMQYAIGTNRPVWKNKNPFSIELPDGRDFEDMRLAIGSSMWRPIIMAMEKGIDSETFNRMLQAEGQVLINKLNPLAQLLIKQTASIRSKKLTLEGLAKDIFDQTLPIPASTISKDKTFQENAADITLNISGLAPRGLTYQEQAEQKMRKIIESKSPETKIKGVKKRVEKLTEEAEEAKRRADQKKNKSLDDILQELTGQK